MENPARDIQYFLMGTELLVHRCEKFVEIMGDHIKKQLNCFTLKSWSARKILDPTTYTIQKVTAPKLK
jgi:hypothetical protein